MKNLLYLLALVVLASCSPDTSPSKIDGDLAFYGKDDFKPEASISVMDLQSKMMKTDTLTDITVSGEIVTTCAKAGCWMTVLNGNDEPMRVRTDHNFFVPVEGMESKKTFFQGRAFHEEISVDWQHHFIDDMNISDEEKEKKKAEITEPKKVVSFLAEGIAIEGVELEKGSDSEKERVEG